MTIIDSITKAHASLSVAFNGVFLPVPKVIESLQRFCRPLAFCNDGHDHDISFSGSCLLVRQLGRNVLLCTRHQLINAQRSSREMIMIVDDAKGGRVGINPNEVSQASLHPSSDPIYADLADIMFAEYATLQPGRDIAAHFLSFDLASQASTRTGAYSVLMSYRAGRSSILSLQRRRFGMLPGWCPGGCHRRSRRLFLWHRRISERFAGCCTLTAQSHREDLRLISLNG